MNGASEKFDVKMIVLKYLHRESALSRFEFIADDEDQTLVDLVVPSLRSDFKLTEDKRHVLEIKDGQLALFKILKSLKLYEWKLLTSNAFALPGVSGSVETVFYYEKSIGNSAPHVGSSAASAPTVAALPAASAVASMASRYTMNLKRTVPTNHSDAAHPPHAENVGGKSGVEEEKSTSSYTHKPLPNVPVRHFGSTPTVAATAAAHAVSHSDSHNAAHHVYQSEAAHNNYHGSNPITEQHTPSISASTSQSQSQSSSHSHGQSIAEADMAMKRVSTNREKLLQKYNQHRRLSTGKADAPTSPGRTSTTATAASWIKPAITVSTAASSAAAAPASAVSSTPLSHAHTTPSSSSHTAHVVHGVHSVHSTAATFASTPPPTPLTSMPPAAPASGASSAASAASTASPTADAPRVNAASAYPSLVRRVSSAKGFVQTSSANNSTNNMTLNTRTSSAENVHVTTTAGSAVDDVATSHHTASEHAHSSDHHNHSTSHSYSVSKTTYTSSTTIIAEDHGGIHTVESAASRPSSFALKNHTAPPSAPLPTTTEVPVAAEPVKSAPVLSSAAPEAPIQKVEIAKEEEGGEPGDEPALRIASHNPLTAQSRVARSSAPAPTAESDQHEVSRTNHYSKLGSAFFSGNALLGPGARRSGGRGSGFLNAQK